MTRPLFRMHIDEVGNADENVLPTGENRYLSLTGVIINVDHAVAHVQPAIDTLKHGYFGIKPTDGVALHRHELLHKKPPFQALEDPETRDSFDRDLLALLRRLDYKVVTVVIDKAAHKMKYQQWRIEPYRYCMMVLIERYVLHLQKINAAGDIMAECRGKRQDRRLQWEYITHYHYGAGHIKSYDVQKYLTSNSLKMAEKKDNIAGLQIADLIASPSYKDILAGRLGEPAPVTFSTEIVTILRESKYLRSRSGLIEGFGRKWLP